MGCRQSAEEQALRGRCHLRLGQWRQHLLEAATAAHAATGSLAPFAALAGADDAFPPGSELFSGGGGPAAAAAAAAASAGERLQ